jgi:glycosyltransferase involved in cell wall biosynthesis
MPSIVFVINNLQGNGAERVVITLADWFAAHGYDCHLVCFSGLRELPSRSDLKIHYFRHSLEWIPPFLRSIFVPRLLDRYILKRIGVPDLVLSNLLKADRIMSRSRLENVILVIHNTISKQLENTKAAQRRRKYSFLVSVYTAKPAICVSKGVMDDFEKLFPGHLPARFIYNPVDVDFILRMAKGKNPFQQTRYFLSVAKFKRAKRHDLLIQAYAQSNVDVPLVLVGKGELLNDMELLVDQLNLRGKVLFAGFHGNPYPIIRDAACMIVSSDFEGLGMVILEALALGVPVISTDCESGPREILPANNLVPVGDVAALAKKISEAAQAPGIFRADLAEHFKIDNAGKQYLSLITDNG